ncbi:glycosyl transferase family protein [Deinococcus peraridilitoris]|uniref:Glycosyl transferase n=1 Tax=Deinococcus peraridilitoris (strain DSM 19664 / LMG 22246 / CIP 109416 / KR-200) TaxID=937777 RepID=L0A6Z7_DEIPD|nr:glycosyl transferase family protein [Deinococcus peraridilitoris]AFZ68967.1 glycosyl transferase [Deinococcus peraridilitoris DSM 19664]
MYETVTVVLALVLIAYLLASIDDILLDLVYIFYHRRAYASRLKAAEIANDTPKRIAVMVAAWKEAGVVGDMLLTTLRHSHYPEERIEFFIGVYPNDRQTLEEITALAGELPNVHCVVNSRPGPTNKSQNLNEVYQAIERLEHERGQLFDAIAVHDAEDVIHPYAFKLYSALLNKHHIVQMPVFALFHRLTWQNALNVLISRTYADEFAEHHMHHVPIRSALGLFVPSAGTGFVMRREVLSHLAQHGPIFNEKSLTEDYELAWRLWRLGYRVHFHLQRLQRLNHRGTVSSEYVAVREYFPNDFTAAVRQKGRWTYGITLQTPTFIDWHALSWRDRLTLLHDQKGKFTNLVHLVGYPAALYTVLAPYLGLPTGDPHVLTPLLLTVLGFTAERLLMRMFAIRAVYGWGEALLSTFVLPFFPLRWFVGNIINACATLRAWRLYFWPGAGAKKGSTPRWDKTERKAYVPEVILQGVRRRLGDALLFYGDLTPRDLAAAVREQHGTHSDRLGAILVQRGKLTSHRLYQRLAEVVGVPFVELDEATPDFTLLPIEAMTKWQLVPLQRKDDRIVVATPLAFEDDRLWSALQDVRQQYGQSLITLALDPQDARHVLSRLHDYTPTTVTGND